jgi:hypothetical protein
LVFYLNEGAQRDRDAIVLCIHATHDEFAEYERLGLRYYRPAIDAISELHLRTPGHPSNAVLRDPRRLYLIVFQGDPTPLLRAAGREIEPFLDLPQLPRPLGALLFEPYRLLKVAPIRPPPSGV